MSEVEVAAEAEEALHHPRPPAPPTDPYPNQIYAWYVVGVLVVAYTFSFIDRQILSLLVQPIKRDLGISDTGMSLLQGFAFAIFYTLMGLPIGRMVDKQKRVTIIAIGVFVWSVMTALCGTAKSFWQLFVYRMGVGVGEAALSPAAYSMLSDYFRPERMGFALGVYSMGIYIGAGLALVIGAEVIALVSGTGTTVVPVFGEIYPWQIVFFTVGLPGILVAAWVYTLREPERRGHMRKERNADGVEVNAAVPLPEVLAYMRRNRVTIMCHHMSYALVAMTGYGIAAWIPTFFIRTHEWTAVDAGRWYGWIIVIFGTFGVISGGFAGDFLTSRGIRNGRLLVIAVISLVAVPFAAAYPLVENPYWALAWLAAATYLSSFAAGAGPAAIQELMPNQMRGFASAFMIFVVTIFGLGLGPTVIALATDYYYADEQMLRYSLAYVPSALLLASSIFGFAGLRPYLRSLDERDRWGATHESP